MTRKGQNFTPTDDTKRSVTPKADALSILWQAIHPTTSDAYSSLRDDFDRAVKEYRLGHYANAEAALDTLIAYVNSHRARTSPDGLEAGQLNALKAAAYSVLGRVYEGLDRSAGAAESFQACVNLYDQIRERGPHEALTPQDYRELGIALYKLGRFDEALYIFETAIKQGDQSAESNTYIGIILQHSGNVEEATAFLRKAVEFSPDDSMANIAFADNLHLQGETSTAITFYLRAAFIVAQNDQWDDALILIERSNELAPRDIRVLSVKAEIFRFAQRFDEALATIDYILEIAPQEASAWGMKGQVLRSMERYSEAVDALNKAITADPELSWSHSELGESLRLLGEHEKALIAFTKALDLDPANSLASEGRAACLVMLERYDEALDALDDVLLQDPKNAFAWAYRGEALRLQGKYEEALVALDRSIELEPNDAFSLGTKGQILRILDRNEEAVQALKRTIEIDSTQVWIYAELGEALRLLKRNEEALSALDKALKLEPDNASVLGSKGAVLYALRKYAEALQVLNQSLAVSSGDYTWAYSLKGAILSELGAFSDAVETLNKVSDNCPRHVLAYTLLLKGWALENLGVEHAEEARKAYEAAGKVDPTSLWSTKGVANSLYLLNRKDEANAAYSEILDRLKKMTGFDAPTMALKGWCLYRVGQYNDAMRRLVDALSLDPNIFYAQFDLALVSMESKRYGLGKREYDRALELTENEYPLRRRGLLHVAIRDLSIAMNNNPELQEANDAIEALTLMQNKYENIKPYSPVEE